MIQHTVVYRLKHAPGSVEERNFQEAIGGLAKIPVVRNLKRHCQVSPKNNFRFGLSMEFASMDDYRTYNEHPLHTDFVANRWVPEVAEFLEIDYEDYR